MKGKCTHECVAKLSSTCYVFSASFSLSRCIFSQTIMNQAQFCCDQEISSQDKEIQFDIEDTQSKEAFTTTNKDQSDNSSKVNQSIDIDSNRNQSSDPVQHGDKLLVLRQEKQGNLHRLANATYKEWNTLVEQSNSPHGDLAQNISEPELRAVGDHILAQSVSCS